MDFKGKNFCISGFDSNEEELLKKVIEELGGVLRSSAVKDLDYLIYDPKFGMRTKKHKKAKELKLNGRDIQILSTNEFISLIKK